MKYGAPGLIRTGDPLLRRQMLYPTELQAHLNCLFYSAAKIPLNQRLRQASVASRGSPLVRYQRTELQAHLNCQSCSEDSSKPTTETSIFCLSKKSRGRCRGTELQAHLKIRLCPLMQNIRVVGTFTRYGPCRAAALRRLTLVQVRGQFFLVEKIGRGGEIRTHDPLLPKQVL